MTKILAVLAVAVSLLSLANPVFAMDRPPIRPSSGSRAGGAIELPMQHGVDIAICAEKGRPIVVAASAFVRQRCGGQLIHTPANVYLILLDCKGRVLSFDTDPGYPNFDFYLPRRREMVILRVFNPNPDPVIVFIRRS